MKKWLQEELKGRQLLKWVLGCSIAYPVYSPLVFAVVTAFGWDIFPPQKTSSEGIPMLTFSFPLLVLSAICREELIFRLPLYFAVNETRSLREVLTVAVILSTLFGLMHGGAGNLTTQGVAGLMLSALFLKSGGLQKRWFKALATTTATHIVFDAIIFAVMIAQGRTHF